MLYFLLQIPAALTGKLSGLVAEGSRIELNNTSFHSAMEQSLPFPVPFPDEQSDKHPAGKLVLLPDVPNHVPHLDVRSLHSSIVWITSFLGQFPCMGP